MVRTTDSLLRRQLSWAIARISAVTVAAAAIAAGAITVVALGLVSDRYLAEPDIITGKVVAARITPAGPNGDSITFHDVDVAFVIDGTTRTETFATNGTVGDPYRAYLTGDGTITFAHKLEHTPTGIFASIGLIATGFVPLIMVAALCRPRRAYRKYLRRVAAELSALGTVAKVQRTSNDPHADHHSLGRRYIEIVGEGGVQLISNGYDLKVTGWGTGPFVVVDHDRHDDDVSLGADDIFERTLQMDTFDLEELPPADVLAAKIRNRLAEIDA